MCVLSIKVPIRKKSGNLLMILVYKCMYVCEHIYGHTHTHTHAYILFANGPRGCGSLPGRIIPKTKKKIVFDAALLNTQHYKVRIKGKVSNPGKGVAPFPTPRCSTY